MGADGGPQPVLAVRKSSVLWHQRTLQSFSEKLLDACPAPEAMFAAHLRSLCRRVGYACFTQSRLCLFVSEAFRMHAGDPPCTGALKEFRKMIPHAAGGFWDECFRLNKNEPFDSCGGHCDIDIRESGHTHWLYE